ncbi:MAG: hypothetical protein LBP89_01500 [Helicobacteraceae bacterium]|jgi:hypothetical protein|nr:hypothetical protein [Helicobacteraceae bacterium]
MILPENISWNRMYHFYMIFGENHSGKEVWREKQWFNVFEPLFNKIIELSPNKKDTGLRVLEYIKENEEAQYYKKHKLGRLRWDKKSHIKWTLKENDKRLFVNFELWTPLWTICEKNSVSPDIYLSFWNEDKTNNKPRQFDTLVTIAIAEDIGKIQNDAIAELSKAFNPKRMVYNQRRWGKGKKDDNKKWYFINSVQDTTSYGIYVGGKDLDIHKTKFEEIVFEPYWKIVY